MILQTASFDATFSIFRYGGQEYRNFRFSDPPDLLDPLDPLDPLNALDPLDLLGLHPLKFSASAARPG